MPFKFYADFECNVKKVNSSGRSDKGENASYTEKYQNHIPCSFAYKVICVDDKFSKPTALCRSENVVYKFIDAIIKEYDYCREVIKQYFNKNLLMSEGDEERFQMSNKCCICDKLFDVGDLRCKRSLSCNKKCRGSAHWSCNVNLKLTKNVPVIFHNLRGYDSHLIIQEINKFDVKVGIIPNGLENT